MSYRTHQTSQLENQTIPFSIIGPCDESNDSFSGYIESFSSPIGSYGSLKTHTVIQSTHLLGTPTHTLLLLTHGRVQAPVCFVKEWSDRVKISRARQGRVL